MDATKYTVTITVQVLDLLSVAALVEDALTHIESEVDGGSLHMNDGDAVSWEIETEGVVF